MPHTRLTPIEPEAPTKSKKLQKQKHNQALGKHHVREGASTFKASTLQVYSPSSLFLAHLSNIHQATVDDGGSSDYEPLPLPRFPVPHVGHSGSALVDHDGASDSRVCSPFNCNLCHTN